MTRCLSAALAVLLLLSLLPGCTPRRGTPLASVAAPSPTAYVAPSLPPTWTAPPPKPTYTLVLQPTPTFTPGPSPTSTRLPSRARALVIGVQDSHTIEVLIDGQPIGRGYIVRLLGIEPPLLSDPWNQVAVEWLTDEIELKVVVLESDEEGNERDAQDNLLRYVWKEGQMVNVQMVQLGLATTSEDISALGYSDDLLSAQAEAQAAERGLWGPPPTLTPTPLITVTATISGTQAPTITLTSTLTATFSLTQTPATTITSSPTP